MTGSREPSVLGAVIDLGHCFNLTDARCLAILKRAYQEYRTITEAAEMVMPENKFLNREPLAKLPASESAPA